jgi:AcrR family transcriptional regulator
MGHTEPAAPTARDRLLDTASRLFYQRGFQGVGIDEIIAESGVAKMTLYRHFPSKDDLIVAYLTRADERFREWFEGALATADSPRDKLLAVFDALGKLAQSEGCLGCTFQVSAAEFPDPRHPAHRVAVRHKRAVRARFATLAAEAGLRDAPAVADQLLMLMDGAWVAARMFGRDNPAAHVLNAATAIIQSRSTVAPPARSKQ